MFTIRGNTINATKSGRSSCTYKIPGLEKSQKEFSPFGGTKSKQQNLEGPLIARRFDKLGTIVLFLIVLFIPEHNYLDFEMRLGWRTKKYSLKSTFFLRSKRALDVPKEQTAYEEKSRALSSQTNASRSRRFFCMIICLLFTIWE